MSSNQTSNLIKEDLNFIEELVGRSEEIIRNEMNFVKYYNQELKALERLELKCFKNDKSLYKLILSVYASYEFTIKRMFEYILEIIDREKINILDLNVNIRALFFKESVNDLRIRVNQKDNDETKEEISKKLVKLYQTLEKEQIFRTKENMINTKSNLKVEILEEIIYYFDIDKNILKSHSSYIKSLVHHRNNIAHGNHEFADRLPTNIMPINEGNYEKLCENIIELTNKLFEELKVYIIEKKYLKNC